MNVKVSVAALDKHGNNIAGKLIEKMKEFSVEHSCHFGIITPRKSVFQKNLDLLYRQSPQSSTAVAYASSEPASKSTKLLQLDDAALVFQGNIYSPVPKNTIMDQLAKQSQHCEAALHKLIEKSDGDYAFFMVKDGWIASGRDPVGVQPLYYGETQDFAAGATNRRALWKLGIENPVSFPPGSLSFANRAGFQFKQVKTFDLTEPKPITMEEAAQKLLLLLEESLNRRTRDVKQVAVAFSGGLDSSLVAYLAAKQGLKVQLLHISMENQSETEEAIEASNQLNLPLQVHLYKDSDVEATLPRVVALIEEADPIKASIGLPFYWTAQQAAEAGFRVVLAGQGADELFGGYQRYVTEYCKEGSEAVRKTIFHDVVNLHLSNLERDLKITSFHDIELRMPFAAFDVAEFAVGLPIKYKMEQKPDTLRKLVLRKTALDAGVPVLMSKKRKKAVQYSTGMNAAVKRVAKKHGKTVNDYIKELFEQSRP